ncbi:MAG: HAMP domain-containing histidine kinase, partial [Chloroflexia bacterium]|nr:HAMP domain-containing histidine kinase [Chloroflexia bacterium]
PNTTVKPGAGLGLAIARHIAEAHGAQLTVRSQVRIGTVFTVVFPR